MRQAFRLFFMTCGVGIYGRCRKTAKGEFYRGRFAANSRVFESDPRLARIETEIQGQKFRCQCAKIDLAIDNRRGSCGPAKFAALPAVIFRLAGSPKG